MLYIQDFIYSEAYLRLASLPQEVVVNTNSQILQVMMKDGTRITFNPSVHDVKSKFRILWLCLFIHPYYMNENKLALKLLLDAFKMKHLAQWERRPPNYL